MTLQRLYRCTTLTMSIDCYNDCRHDLPSGEHTPYEVPYIPRICDGGGGRQGRHTGEGSWTTWDQED